jgi:hypothetical protein
MFHRFTHCDIQPLRKGKWVTLSTKTRKTRTNNHEPDTGDTKLRAALSTIGREAGCICKQPVSTRVEQSLLV